MNAPTPNDVNASLSSLAMLSVQLSTGKDYLDYLNGFVIEAMRTMQTDGFDAVSIQKAVDKQFCLKIPAATFAIYLKRLVKAKIISPTKQGLLYRVNELPTTTISKDRNSAQMRIKEVTDELAGFAHRQYSLVWNEQKSAHAVAEFLRQYSIDFLRFAEARSPLPEEASNTKSTDYVVASFITKCAKDRPGIFDSIKVLVQSHILANALMCPDLEKSPRGFKDVNFLADTRFLLKALDLESQYDTDNSRQLISAVRKLKGSVCIFNETKNELRRVLRAIIKGMQQGNGRGPVCRELIKRGRGVADVILTESKLDEALTSLSISVLPSPRYDENNYQFQIDETELRNEIENEVDYITQQAAEHDIRVVRHIFALRKGRKASRIEDCHCVLLTTNSALSRAAFHYEKSTTNAFFFSAVITDYHLSHLAWLKSPMEVPDLPRVELLANCYATMRPHESFWNRYISEIDRLKAENKVSEQDHEVLRFSISAPDELMEVTRGEVEGITEKNVHSILSKLEKMFATEKEKTLQREQLEHKKTKVELIASNQSIEAAQREIAALQTQRVILEQDKATIAAELQNFKTLENAARENAKRNHKNIQVLANWIAKIVFYVLGLIFAFVGLLAILNSANIWYGVPASVLGFLNLWVGFSGNSVERRVKNWLEIRLSRLIS